MVSINTPTDGETFFVNEWINLSGSASDAAATRVGRIGKLKQSRKLPRAKTQITRVNPPTIRRTAPIAAGVAPSGAMG
jgi:hypothetical protein